MLKRGMAFGGAVMWTTPLVQAIGMRAAAAQEASPTCTTYCLKLVTADAYNIMTGLWDSTQWESFKTPADNCLTCPLDVSPKAPPPALASSIEVTGNPGVGVTITIPEGCELVPPDPTPDELVNGSAAVRCGNSGIFGCNYTYTLSNGTIAFGLCANGRAITQIELIIRCCP